MNYTENKMTVATVQPHASGHPGCVGHREGDLDTKDKYTQLPSHAIYFSLIGLHSPSELLLSSLRSRRIRVNALCPCPSPEEKQAGT